MLKTNKITKKQKEILYYLYKFYFLNTNQLQKLCHHKKPQTVQKWLKDLKDKNYINAYDFKENKFVAKTQPTVYYLDKLARQKLKNDEKCELSVLKRVYQIKSLSKEFIKNCILIADIYIDLESQMKDKEKLYFLTTANLKDFDYFPTPKPNAYIAIKKPKKTTRFFLFIINHKIPWRVLDQIMSNYADYSYNNNWANYSSNPLPSFLIICPNKTTEKHIYKVLNDEALNASFYLSTKDIVQESGLRGDIWEKVET
jgi:hypothetical protein